MVSSKVSNMLMICRITPWKDWAEWMAVKNTLFNDESSSNIDWALDVIRLWKSRGKIPHSVESTAQLIEVCFI